MTKIEQITKELEQKRKELVVQRTAFTTVRAAITDYTQGNPQKRNLDWFRRASWFKSQTHNKIETLNMEICCLNNALKTARMEQHNADAVTEFERFKKAVKLVCGDEQYKQCWDVVKESSDD